MDPKLLPSLISYLLVLCVLVAVLLMQSQTGPAKAAPVPIDKREAQWVRDENSTAPASESANSTENANTSTTSSGDGPDPQSEVVANASESVANANDSMAFPHLRVLSNQEEMDNATNSTTSTGDGADPESEVMANTSDSMASDGVLPSFKGEKIDVANESTSTGDGADPESEVVANSSVFMESADDSSSFEWEETGFGLLARQAAGDANGTVPIVPAPNEANGTVPIAPAGGEFICDIQLSSLDLSAAENESFEAEDARLLIFSPYFPENYPGGKTFTWYLSGAYPLRNVSIRFEDIRLNPEASDVIILLEPKEGKSLMRKPNRPDPRPWTPSELDDMQVLECLTKDNNTEADMTLSNMKYILHETTEYFFLILVSTQAEANKSGEFFFKAKLFTRQLPLVLPTSTLAHLLTASFLFVFSVLIVLSVVPSKSQLPSHPERRREIVPYPPASPTPSTPPTPRSPTRDGRSSRSPNKSLDPSVLGSKLARMLPRLSEEEAKMLLRSLLELQRSHQT